MGYQMIIPIYASAESGLPLQKSTNLVPKEDLGHYLVAQHHTFVYDACVE